MSKYTPELRSFFEQFSHYTGNPPAFPSHAETIELGRGELFDFDYPIFDPLYKKVFETHFIRTFYMREIGFETFGLFKFRLETWLQINMPYWNKMFQSELLQYDPLKNSEMDVTHTKTNDKTQNDTRNATTHGTSSGDGTSSNTQVVDGRTTKDEDSTVTDDNFNRQIESNNPDTRLTLTANDGEGVIEYASKIKENNENNTQDISRNGTTTTDNTITDNGEQHQESITDVTGDETLESTINDTEDFVQHRIGKIGVQSYAKLVTEYRNALLRIENDIFAEMNQLFMLVY